MRTRLLSLLFASALSACAGQGGEDDSARLTQPIVDGTPSGKKQDAVVSLLVQDLVLGKIAVACSGTLVASNLVLTSRRCLSPFHDDYPTTEFSCTPEGYIDTESPRSPINAGELGLLAQPEDVWVFVGQDPERSEPDARGVRIFSYFTESVCRNDIAYVLLDTALAPDPKLLRLSAGVSLGESTRVLGYGNGTSGPGSGRQERRDLPVLALGEGPYSEGSGETPVRTFMLGESACRQRDAGGPALSEETGAVLGVFSYTAGGICDSAETRNVFTEVAAYPELALDAFAAAGHEPRLEPGSEIPSTGAGGEGGAPSNGGAGDRSQQDGGVPEDGAETNPPTPRRRDAGCNCRLTAKEPTAWPPLVVATLGVVFGGLRRRKRGRQGRGVRS